MSRSIHFFSRNYIHWIFLGLDPLWQLCTSFISYLVEQMHLQILPFIWKVKCQIHPSQIFYPDPIIRDEMLVVIMEFCQGLQVFGIYQPVSLISDYNINNPQSNHPPWKI